MLDGLHRDFHKGRYTIPQLPCNQEFVLWPEIEKIDRFFQNCAGFDENKIIQSKLLTALVLVYPNPKTDFKEIIKEIFIFGWFFFYFKSERSVALYKFPRKICRWFELTDVSKWIISTVNLREFIQACDW